MILKATCRQELIHERTELLEEVQTTLWIESSQANEPVLCMAYSACYLVAVLQVTLLRDQAVVLAADRDFACKQATLSHGTLYLEVAFTHPTQVHTLTVRLDKQDGEVARLQEEASTLR